MKFNAEETKIALINWIRNWFNENGKDCNAVVGLSGGKDSTIVAALCVEALGKERVIGVAMPEQTQGLNDADKIAEYLGIQFIVAPIADMVNAFTPYAQTAQAAQNVPPRVRMTTLYAISQSNNGRVMGTCNKSENAIGYFTIFGDGACDVEPLGNLTVRQVVAIGHSLGLPQEWVDKIPDDGLPFSVPDDVKLANWGFNYKFLDEYLENGTSGDSLVDKYIEKRIKMNAFKLKHAQMFNF